MTNERRRSAASSEFTHVIGRRKVLHTPPPDDTDIRTCRVSTDLAAQTTWLRRSAQWLRQGCRPSHGTALPQPRPAEARQATAAPPCSPRVPPCAPAQIDWIRSAAGLPARADSLQFSWVGPNPRSLLRPPAPSRASRSRRPSASALRTHPRHESSTVAQGTRGTPASVRTVCGRARRESRVWMIARRNERAYKSADIRSPLPDAGGGVVRGLPLPVRYRSMRQGVAMFHRFLCAIAASLATCRLRLIR